MADIKLLVGSIMVNGETNRRMSPISVEKIESIKKEKIKIKIAYNTPTTRLIRNPSPKNSRSVVGLTFSARSTWRDEKNPNLKNSAVKTVKDPKKAYTPYPSGPKYFVWIALIPKPMMTISIWEPNNKSVCLLVLDENIFNEKSIKKRK